MAMNTAELNGVIAIAGTITGTITGATANPKLQEKTAHAGNVVVTVTPDEGYDGLSKVSIEKVAAEAGVGDAGTVDIDYRPTAPAHYFTGFKVNAVPLQAKSVSPSSSQQVIEPDNGYLGLSSVTVAAATGGGAINYGSEPEIGAYALYGASGFTEVDCAGASVVIGLSAFENSSLQVLKLTATSGAPTISSRAFAGCTALTDIWLHSTTMVDLDGTTAFQGTSGVTVHVPSELVATYQADTIWNNIGATFVAIA